MSRPKGTSRVAELGLVEEVEELLQDRWTPQRVAEYLNRKYNLTPPLTKDHIRSYRDQIMDKTKIRPPKWIEERLEERTSLIDILVERARLIRLQWQRIQKLVEMEDAMPVTLPLTHKEFQLLNELIESIKRDYQDYGIFPKAPEKIEGEITENIITRRLNDFLDEHEEEGRELLLKLGKVIKPYGS